MHRLAIIFASFACVLGGSAHAQYPDRPIHLIVPQAAGSATDTVARVLAAALSPELGREVVVDDRPGGALTIGLDLTAKSAPDGYTLCMGPIGALAISPHLVKNLPYDIAHNFAPIALVSRGQLLLAVSPTTPFHSVKELIDYAKANPGKLSNASSSNGSPGHVGGELFKFMTGTDIVHVPYKGGAPAQVDLLAGQVQMMFDPMQSTLAQVLAGRLRMLAISSKERSAALPSVPTIAESGYPGFEMTAWWGVFAPAHLPEELAASLAASVEQVATGDSFRSRMEPLGVHPRVLKLEAFAEFQRSEIKKWGEAVRASGASVE